MKDEIAEFLFTYRWGVVGFLLGNCIFGAFSGNALLAVLSSATGMIFIMFVMSYEGKK